MSVSLLVEVWPLRQTLASLDDVMFFVDPMNVWFKIAAYDVVLFFELILGDIIMFPV